MSHNFNKKSPARNQQFDGITDMSHERTFTQQSFPSQVESKDQFQIETKDQFGMFHSTMIKEEEDQLNPYQENQAQLDERKSPIFSTQPSTSIF